MQQYTYVIVGGGIAGTTAAETIRKRDSVGKIAIISDEPHVCYSRVLLSKPGWVLGQQPFDTVWIKNDAWYQTNNIHLFKAITATSLNVAEQLLTLSDGDVLHYEKLLLATGAHNRPWNIPGSTLEGVRHLRTVDDAHIISDLIQGPPKHVVLVGSSCVSFEIIEILHSRGHRITEVMREKYFFEPQLALEAVEPIECTLDEKGIEIVRGMEIVKVLGKEHVTGVVLKSGRTINCDYVLPFIGVELPILWLKDAGIATHKGIYANEYLETNVPNVWTAGDTTENWDVALGETVLMGNWMSARLQGEVAGKNMVGLERTPFEQVSFHTSHGFGYQIGWVGDVRPLPDRTAVRVFVKNENNEHCRVMVWHGRVVGATTVNRADLMGVITKLIQKKVFVGDVLEGIASGSVSLMSLVEQPR